MCNRVYTATEWGMHRKDELNRRKGKAKPDYKGQDGLFRCVVPGCEWSSGGHNKVFKKHLMGHTEAELLASGIALKVSESMNDLTPAL